MTTTEQIRSMTDDAKATAESETGQPVHEIPDDVLEKVCNRVLAAMKANDSKQTTTHETDFYYNIEDAHGHVSFYSLKAGSNNQIVMGSIDDQRWCEGGLFIEQTFTEHEDEARNWDDATTWVIQRVDALAIGWASHKVRFPD